MAILLADYDCVPICEQQMCACLPANPTLGSMLPRPELNRTFDEVTVTVDSAGNILSISIRVGNGWYAVDFRGGKITNLEGLP